MLLVYFEANNFKNISCSGVVISDVCNWNVVSLREMVELFNQLAGNPDCRVVVFSGAGKMFTAGRSLSSSPPPPCFSLQKLSFTLLTLSRY